MTSKEAFLKLVTGTNSDWKTKALNRKRMRTIVETAHIPYSKVVEKRGVRIGDVTKWAEYTVIVQQDVVTNGMVQCRIVHPDGTSFEGPVLIITLYYEVDALYTFE